MKKLAAKSLLICATLASAIFVSAGDTKLTDQWQIKTSNGKKIPAGWEPFG